MIVRERLISALSAALVKAREAGSVTAEETPPIKLDIPPAELGDFSSDIAVTLSRQSRQPAAAVAEALAANLDVPRDLVDRVEVAGSGFLNFHLKAGWFDARVRDIRTLRDQFGRSTDLGDGSSVQVEFVSANPTSPLNVTHGRGAALGDALATVLEWNGYRVTREFYVNDSGTQMDRFGTSLEARYLQSLGHTDVQVPVDGYSGEYLMDLAGEMRERTGEEYAALPREQRLQAITRWGRDAVIRRHQETLSRFGVRFDEWYSETALHENGTLDEVLAVLRRNDHAYEADGALWLRSTRFGDEEDRALIRSNGRPSYIAGDLAYHLEKYRRGFDHVIDIWSSDHAGYIGRTRAGIRALGCNPEAVEILIFEPVFLKIGGTIVEGSAHPGNNTLLGEVIEEVGKDAARFIYLTRPAGSPLEFDLDLAKEQTPQNPYHEVRATLTEARGILAAAPLPEAETDLSPLVNPVERSLLRRLSDFPDEVRAAARERDPYRITRYVRETAQELGVFIGVPGSESRVPRSESRVPSPVTAARLALTDAAVVVLENAVAVLGTEA
jgi:arginyl-tRNA synthetase